MDSLEEYYNKNFYGPGFPEYSLISEKMKSRLRNTLGFAGWQARKAAEKFKIEIRKLIK